MFPVDYLAAHYSFRVRSSRNALTNGHGGLLVKNCMS